MVSFISKLSGANSWLIQRINQFITLNRYIKKFYVTSNIRKQPETQEWSAI